jgi:hypothetical protein
MNNESDVMNKYTVLLILAIIAEVVTTTAMASSWKFAVLADSRAEYWDDNGFGVAANTLGILVNDMKTQGVDLVIYPGDMIYGSGNLSKDLDSWKSVMKPLSDAGIPICTTRGNHEGSSDKNKIARYRLFIKQFPLMKDATSPDGGFTYSFTHKNAKFIGFDQWINRKTSFDRTLYAQHSNQGQMMNSWVTSEINNSSSPLNFAFAHGMLFPSKSHPDCMANDPDSRDALVAALGTHHGTYLCGHDHMYLRVTASDGNGHAVPELVVGTAGGSWHERQGPY